LQILLNGERFVTEATSLYELCASLGFADAKVATAVNGSFVAATARGQTRLADADEVEIVAPRQGG
jgi:sulfur carrier protein